MESRFFEPQRETKNRGVREIEGKIADFAGLSEANPRETTLRSTRARDFGIPLYDCSSTEVGKDGRIDLPYKNSSNCP